MPELKNYFHEVSTRMPPGGELYTEYEAKMIDRVRWIDAQPPVADVKGICDDLDRVNAALAQTTAAH